MNNINNAMLINGNNMNKNHLKTLYVNIYKLVFQHIPPTVRHRCCVRSACPTTPASGRPSCAYPPLNM